MIFRIFREILGGYRGEGPMISAPNPTPNLNMAPPDNKLVPLALFRGQTVGRATKSPHLRPSLAIFCAFLWQNLAPLNSRGILEKRRFHAAFKRALAIWGKDVHADA
jgi:hypothetical protein